MIEFLVVLIFVANVALAFKIAPKGHQNKIGYELSLLACIFLGVPIGWFLTENSQSLHAKGCKFCGNEYNEATYCGICGKNEEGLMRN